MSELITHLEALSNAPGISGDEIEVRRIIRPLCFRAISQQNSAVLAPPTCR